jgi:hypothetical protein
MYLPRYGSSKVLPNLPQSPSNQPALNIKRREMPPALSDDFKAQKPPRPSRMGRINNDLEELPIDFDPYAYQEIGRLPHHQAAKMPSNLPPKAL